MADQRARNILRGGGDYTSVDWDFGSLGRIAKAEAERAVPRTDIADTLRTAAARLAHSMLYQSQPVDMPTESFTAEAPTHTLEHRHPLNIPALTAEKELPRQTGGAAFVDSGARASVVVRTRETTGLPGHLFRNAISIRPDYCNWKRSRPPLYSGEAMPGVPKTGDLHRAEPLHSVPATRTKAKACTPLVTHLAAPVERKDRPNVSHGPSPAVSALAAHHPEKWSANVHPKQPILTSGPNMFAPCSSRMAGSAAWSSSVQHKQVTPAQAPAAREAKKLKPKAEVSPRKARAAGMQAAHRDESGDDHKQPINTQGARAAVVGVGEESAGSSEQQAVPTGPSAPHPSKVEDRSDRLTGRHGVSSTRMLEQDSNASVKHTRCSSEEKQYSIHPKKRASQTGISAFHATDDKESNARPKPKDQEQPLEVSSSSTSGRKCSSVFSEPRQGTVLAASGTKVPGGVIRIGRVSTAKSPAIPLEVRQQKHKSKPGVPVQSMIDKRAVTTKALAWWTARCNELQKKNIMEWMNLRHLEGRCYDWIQGQLEPDRKYEDKLRAVAIGRKRVEKDREEIKVYHERRSDKLRALFGESDQLSDAMVGLRREIDSLRVYEERTRQEMAVEIVDLSRQVDAARVEYGNAIQRLEMLMERSVENSQQDTLQHLDDLCQEKFAAASKSRGSMLEILTGRNEALQDELALYEHDHETRKLGLEGLNQKIVDLEKLLKEAKEESDAHMKVYKTSCQPDDAIELKFDRVERPQL